MVKYFGEKNYEHGSDDKTGVLITNLGTPDAPKRKELKKYVNQFLSDPRVIEIPKFIWQLILQLVILQIRPSKSAAAYKKIWTENDNKNSMTSEDVQSSSSELDDEIPF